MAPPVQEVEDRDFVTPAQDALVGLKSDLVVAKGATTMVSNKVEELFYIEEGLRLRGVRWKKFRANLAGCWQAPFAPRAGAQARPVDRLSAAKSLRNDAAMAGLPAVRDSVDNEVGAVRACPEATAEKLSGLSRRARDEVRAWASAKLQLLNEARVLLRRALPARSKALPDEGLATSNLIARQLAEAQAWHTAIATANNEPASRKVANQIRMLETMSSEAAQLKAESEATAAQLRKRIDALTAEVGAGLNSFGK